MRKKIKRLVIVVAALALPVAAWMALAGSDENTSYRTALVTKGSIAEVVTANGTLNPTDLISVGTQVSGQISKLYVKLNDEVKKGQLLAEVDPAIPLAQLKQSRANMETSRTAFELAGRNLERARTLVAKEYVPKTELENSQQNYQSAQNAYENAKSQVEKDEVNLSYTKITAPIDGVIISQEVTEGQTMAANFQTPNLFKIAGDLTRMKIDVAFSEADISKIHAGQPVTFTVDAFADREFSGTVQMVNLNPNNQSGVVTYTVTVQVENKDKLLLPGMTAFVRVILSEQKDVLRVPAAALRFSPPAERVSGFSRLFQPNVRGARMGGTNKPMSADGNQQTLYLLKDGTLKPVQVKIGSTDDTYVEVSGEGINEGDTVVTGITPAKR
jgi:HlyD family secretion protein